MDVIGLIEPTTSNGHWFILVAIDYFTKWVEAASYKVVTKKVVADFVKDRIVCRFRVSKSIITDNAANLNSDLMKDIFRMSTGSTPYMLVYGTEDVIPAKVEIPSLRVIQEAELNDAEWIRSCYEQLALIDGKRMNTVSDRVVGKDSTKDFTGYQFMKVKQKDFEDFGEWFCKTMSTMKKESWWVLELYNGCFKLSGRVPPPTIGYMVIYL
ncbi:uncharacterized protein [Nicotiana sylvestris]|uniref:uncharacterized protein n=1 Tax=Nicotiana sylvestris TaxID=4096 RepID=UPI00388CE2ED